MDTSGIKQQGDQQWEDKMMITQDTSIEIYVHDCLFEQFYFSFL